MQIHDLGDLLAAQRPENDDVVDAIQKLRLEVAAQRLRYLGLDQRPVVGPLLQDPLAADVARHDDDRIPEVDGSALRIGEAPVIEDLQQDVEDVGMGLLDLVEEDDRVRPAADGLGQLPALLESDITGRRADEPRHRVSLHVLAHVDPHHRLLVVEQEAGEGAGRLRLADARGPEKNERTDWTIGVLKPRARTTNGVRHRVDRYRLTNDAPPELGVQLRQAFLLALHHPRDGNPRPVGDDFGDVVGAHFFLEEARPTALLRRQPRLGFPELRFELWHAAILNLGGCAEVAGSCGAFDVRPRLLDLLLETADVAERVLLVLPLSFHRVTLFAQRGEFLFDGPTAILRRRILFLREGLTLDLELDDPPLDLIDDLRQGIDLYPQPARRLVDEIDGLVGQESVADVPITQCRRGHDRAVGNAHPVMALVALLETAEDGDRVLDAWLPDEHRLEPALERWILLDVLPILVQGRGAYHA